VVFQTYWQIRLQKLLLLFLLPGLVLEGHQRTWKG
jgi:hypothetical protein